MGTIWATTKKKEKNTSAWRQIRNLHDITDVNYTFQLATPSGDDAAGALRLRDLARMRHADNVDVWPASGRLDETEQSDIVGQRQIVELRVDHHVRHVQLLVRQLFRSHAHVVFAQTDLQHGANVAAGQTVHRKQHLAI